MIGQVRVLLVEDNAADADLTREIFRLEPIRDQTLRGRGWRCGNKLPQRLGKWSEPGHPTLILLDLNLPRKDGRQVLAVIKSEDLLRRIPVVVLSSSDSERDITNCYDLGANCYIVKRPSCGATVQSFE
jgi:CheY-like chemotaxis protein